MSLERLRRHKRILKRMHGTKDKPRLIIFRSSKNIYAQLVDDDAGKVVASYSSISKDFKAKKIKSTDINAAKEVGKAIAVKAKELNVTAICFDRSGYKYHGKIKALADGAREGGLKF